METPPSGRPPAISEAPKQQLRPHVELDFFGQPQVVVRDVGQPVAGPRPGLDLEACHRLRRSCQGTQPNTDVAPTGFEPALPP
jgi:hypothetical protein